MLSFLLLSGLSLGAGLADRVAAPDLDEAADPGWLAEPFHRAAQRHQVPEELLLALAWEASHWNPDLTSRWGGYGLFDFREPGEGPGPDLERAATLLDRSPDDLIAHPAAQIQAAAALLAHSARLAHDGELPSVHDLAAWGTAVASFSGRHEPHLQDMYTRYVYQVVREGVVRGGLVLPATDVELPDWLALAPPPASACDYSGCYQFVAAHSSNYTNQSRTAADISTVVIHTVQGSYSSCISWFQNPEADVSAHYVVRSSDGQVTQMVLEEDKAWHVGEANGYSVGIEHEGFVDDPDTWYTDAMYAGSAALTADIAARNGIPISRSYIIGHSEAPGATHTDPGSGWDWDYYMDLVSGGEVTGDIIGLVRDSDIYAGANLVGATVWIDETGESTTVDSDGYYRFYDLPLDSYTMWASHPGYLDGSCTKSIGAGDNWCSIALVPGEDDPGDGGAAGDGGAPGDGGADGQPGGDPTPPPGASGTPPGGAVALDQLQGGCSAAPLPAAWALALGGLLGIGRRRSRI